jgi:hypothetical protein
MPGSNFPGQFELNERANAQPVHCYTFARGGTLWHYTDQPADVTVDGVTYRAAVISHSPYERDDETASGELTITMSAETPIVSELNGREFDGPPISLIIRQTHRSGVGGVSPTTAVRYSGWATLRTLKGGVCELTIASITSLLDRPLLRWVCGATCNKVVFGMECGVDPAPFTTSGCAVSAISGRHADGPRRGAPARRLLHGRAISSSSRVPRPAEQAHIESHVGSTLVLMHDAPRRSPRRTPSRSPRAATASKRRARRSSTTSTTSAVSPRAERQPVRAGRLMAWFLAALVQCRRVRRDGDSLGTAQPERETGVRAWRAAVPDRRSDGARARGVRYDARRHQRHPQGEGGARREHHPQRGAVVRVVPDEDRRLLLSRRRGRHLPRRSRRGPRDVRRQDEEALDPAARSVALARRDRRDLRDRARHLAGTPRLPRQRRPGAVHHHRRRAARGKARPRWHRRRRRYGVRGHHAVLSRQRVEPAEHAPRGAARRAAPELSEPLLGRVRERLLFRQHAGPALDRVRRHAATRRARFWARDSSATSRPTRARTPASPASSGRSSRTRRGGWASRVGADQSRSSPCSTRPATSASRRLPARALVRAHRQVSAKQVLSDVLRTIDGVLYTDPRDGADRRVAPPVARTGAPTATTSSTRTRSTGRSSSRSSGRSRRRTRRRTR